MKRFLCATFLLLSSAAWAEDLKAYLDALDTKLEHAGRRANQATSQGSKVVGLRGSNAEADAKSKLYWKGSSPEAAPQPEEVRLLRQAVAQAEKGATEEAVTTLQTFLKDYPKSSLKPDAEALLAKLTPAKN